MLSAILWYLRKKKREKKWEKQKPFLDSWLVSFESYYNLKANLDYLDGIYKINNDKKVSCMVFVAHRIIRW